MKAKLLWITDPWETLDHPKDTTLRLIEESAKLRVPAFWADVSSIRWQDGKTSLLVREVREAGPLRRASDFKLSPPRLMQPSEFSQIHFRTDPPVDAAYLHPLQLLVHGISRKTELVNPAEVLFSANEKLECTSLARFHPPSLISSQWEVLEAFGRKQKTTVLKPLAQAQSKGVQLLDWRSREAIEQARPALALATDGFRRPVLLQAFLKGIAQGETRLWFLDGKLLAHAKKLPVKGDFRVNMDAGSQLAPAKLSGAETRATAAIGKHLKARKIRLAAVDLIEGLVTDFNFTSPGLIVQMEELLDENLAKKIIQKLITA